MHKHSPLIKARRILLKSVITCLFGISFALLADQLFAAETSNHPMDPLSAQEYSTVIKILKEGNYVFEDSRYPLITLEEPTKADVVKWKPGNRLPRKAFVIVMKGPETFEAVVDIIEGKVESWKQIKDVQPGILLTEEWYSSQKIVRDHPEWQKAIRKRGINNLETVICIPHTIGYHGIPEEEGRRLVKVTCYDSGGIKNFWGRPIEGLIAIVDHDKREVIKLIDTGEIPIPKAQVDYNNGKLGRFREPHNAIEIVQPQGPSFKVDGHVVSWQKWQFHYRIDPRLGPVVSLVRYKDNGKMRSIMYQGSISELFVPYMDPTAGWYFKSYMDAGEYGLGKLASTLQPGLDCPSNAVFFDAEFAYDWGEPYKKERAACIFERYAGDIVWRHYETVYDSTEVRRSTDLVLRQIIAAGNYDYIIDWVFRQDGSIRIVIGSTGISQVKAVKSHKASDNKDRLDIRYGHMVADKIVGINHDHFFNFRIDLDVDGPENSFLIERLKTEKAGKQSPRKSIWVVDSQMADKENDAKLRIDIEKPALWRVINPNVLGPLGYPVSYQLKPKSNAVSLLNPDDFPQLRAGFTDYHMWVTPYNSQERYAAGTYPNQSKGGDGLPKWTNVNRPIRNTDIVLWYTLGFHHVVRAEDWPVLPTIWNEFELRPFDFFEQNPAIDLPQ